MTMALQISLILLTTTQGDRLQLFKTGLLPNNKLPIFKMSNLTDFDNRIDF